MEKLFSPGKLRSEKTARLISLLVPGLGQLYAGKPGRAISSLLLTGAAGGFAALCFITGYPLEGIFTGAGLFFKFYTGGSRYAGLLASNRNRILRNSVKEKIKFMVQKIELAE